MKNEPKKEPQTDRFKLVTNIPKGTPGPPREARQQRLGSWLDFKKEKMASAAGARR